MLSIDNMFLFYVDRSETSFTYIIWISLYLVKEWKTGF